MSYIEREVSDRVIPSCLCTLIASQLTSFVNTNFYNRLGNQLLTIFEFFNEYLTVTLR